MAVGATAAVVAVVGEVVVEMVAEARVAGVRAADSAQAMTVAVQLEAVMVAAGRVEAEMVSEARVLVTEEAATAEVAEAAERGGT